MADRSVTADLKVKGRASYLIFLQNVNELAFKRPDAPPCTNEAGERDYHLETIKKYILGLSGGTLPDGELLLNHRQSLIRALKDVYVLNLYTHIAKEWVKHGQLLYAAAHMDTPVPADGRSLFFTHLQAMMDVSEDGESVSNGLLQDAMSRLPLRMATVKYKGYVADSLMEYVLPVTEASAEEIKRVFNPMDFIKDNEWLAEIREDLDLIWNRDCAAMDAESIRADNTAIENVRSKTAKLVDYICVLLDGVNAAYIAMLYCPDEYERAEARKLTESRLDEAVEAELKKITYQFNAQIPIEENECGRITKLFYETGLDYFNYIEEDADEDDIDIEAFLAVLLPCIEAPMLAANRRRFLRQRFMAYLPYPYGIEEYQQYFLDTYASLNDANRRYLYAYVEMQMAASLEKNGK